MQQRNAGRAKQRPSLLPAPAARTVRQRRTAPTYCYLLDADADLADEFDLRMRVVARQVATAEVVEVEAGPCELWASFRRGAGGPGLLILDGVMAADVRVIDRTATELVGAGDLLQPRVGSDDAIVEPEATWHALLPTRLAVLDGAFAERVRPWPQIGQALLRRAERRAASVGAQRAIACQPRLEVRLDLLLWHYAGRWGRVEPGGIRLSLPLTHRLLGLLAGAERPSVTHALARLADAGLVTGPAAELHLHGTFDEHVAWFSKNDMGHHAPAFRQGAAG
jgi:CRP/FNR family transcriptional regulator, cyclic AMP receptor protein